VAKFREPLGQGAHGRLAVLTEDELGARLLRDTLPTPVSKVTVRRLRWRPPPAVQDAAAEVWIVEGTDEASPAFDVAAGDRPGARRPRDGAAHRDGPFDYMADLEHDAARAAAKRRRAAGGPDGRSGVQGVFFAIADEINEVQANIADLFEGDPDGDVIAEELRELLRQEDEHEREQVQEEIGQEEEEEEARGAMGEDPSLASEERELSGEAEVLDSEAADYTALLASLSFEYLEGGRCIDRSAAATVLGRIHEISGNLKATCKIRGHGTCTCFVRIPPGMRRHVEVDLLQWLDAGNRGASEQEHYRMSCALRSQKYGMKLRSR
jgi:hypothetical protein